MRKGSNLIFTGGGSGGHVVPAITLIGPLKKIPNLRISYIGSKNGIEKELVSKHDILYKDIPTGKLRRYLSFQNFLDIFKVLLGIIISYFYLLKFNRKNTIIFSTGGFVSLPVVIAAKLQFKDVMIHEQTSRVGLANKIASKFANIVYISFESSKDYFDKSKVVYSGYPVRESCYLPTREDVIIDNINVSKIKKDVLFITGGGNGSKLLNDLILNELENLKTKFFIIHQVGKRFIDQNKKYKDDNYLPLAFLSDEIIELMKLSKVVISRAGAGTVCELLAMNKRSIYIPLKIAQKNEQFFNAEEAKNKLGSIIIEEDEIDSNFKISNTIDSFLELDDVNIKACKVKISAADFLKEEILTKLNP